MQAVILAAGLGTRMKELTQSKSKPMLELCGKSLIEHKLDVLPDSIDEVIIVVGYKKEVTMNHIGNEYKGIKITYVVQDVLNGTGGALWLCKGVLHDKFLVLMGDDIYMKEDLNKMINGDWSVLAQQQEGENCTGALIIKDDVGNLKEILEGQSVDRGLFNTGAYMLDTRIFNYELTKLEGKEEYGLPQTIVKAINHIDIQLVTATEWICITSPEDIIYAEKILCPEYISK